MLCVMSPLGEDTLSNLSFIDVVYLYINRLLSIFGLTSQIPINLCNDDFSVKQLVVKYDDLISWFSFDEFQVKLLKGFLAILFFNVILIFCMWKIYGSRICLRFMKPATTKVIEELRKSVSQLKLPKEHTPRI